MARVREAPTFQNFAILRSLFIFDLLEDGVHVLLLFQVLLFEPAEHSLLVPARCPECVLSLSNCAETVVLLRVNTLLVHACV